MLAAMAAMIDRSRGSVPASPAGCPVRLAIQPGLCATAMGCSSTHNDWQDNRPSRRMQLLVSRHHNPRPPCSDAAAGLYTACWRIERIVLLSGLSSLRPRHGSDAVAARRRSRRARHLRITHTTTTPTPPPGFCTENFDGVIPPACLQAGWPQMSPARIHFGSPPPQPLILHLTTQSSKIRQRSATSDLRHGTSPSLPLQRS